MAFWHLSEIENSLNKIGWRITERMETDEKNAFIGGWKIERGTERIVGFDGIEDGLGNIIDNPSIEKANGCYIKETDISVYFYKKGHMWKNALKKFIDEVNELKKRFYWEFNGNEAVRRDCKTDCVTACSTVSDKAGALSLSG